MVIGDGSFAAVGEDVAAVLGIVNSAHENGPGELPVFESEGFLHLHDDAKSDFGMDSPVDSEGEVGFSVNGCQTDSGL